MPDQKKKEATDWSAVPMQSEARKYFEDEFRPRIAKLRHAASSTPLSVLVWGPTENGGPLYRKRLQIRAELRACNIAAVFSEEIETTSEDLSTRANELFQALAADFIVILQGSPGSTAEVHDFGAVMEGIGSKMLIFIDERHKDGYSFNGLLDELNTRYANVKTFRSPQDLDECNLLGAVLKRISVLRLAKWRAQLT